MSVSLAFKQSLMARNPQERLSKVLKKNKNRFNISKDGFINMDLQSVEVQAEIEKQLIKLGNFHAHIGKLTDK
ncbi:hypothetical protein LLR08_16425 [Rouxiella badensis]|uniref:hypothetical protein n=1 Tax=Rouxiella badensis TaxID=1646377 RepID=UPI001D138D17|nr:hypothetical protein [Rouxiella badensis]MCC3704148.1 hypothetical protein [Rouxiella badensis]